MKAIRLGAWSTGALALAALVGDAAAQTTSSAVLNSLEVRELIRRAEPADHARLEVHFAVLAEQYAAEAKATAPWRRRSSQVRFGGPQPIRQWITASASSS